MENVIKIALVGNPNTGKTSIFNILTGLNHKVGNYPGITVERVEGYFTLSNGIKVHINDLPGTYSLNATSNDEHIVFDALLNEKHADFPDVVVVVAEIENLKRNLFLFSQIKDLEIPTILVVNMIDQIDSKGITIDFKNLELALGTKIIPVSARKKSGFEALKAAIENYKLLNIKGVVNFSDRIQGFFIENIQSILPEFSWYKSWLLITRNDVSTFLSPEVQQKIDFFRKKTEKIKKFQHKETIYRYQVIGNLVQDYYTKNRLQGTDLRGKLDRILTHKIWGYLIFALILTGIFQSVFAWASFPMDWIDRNFSLLANYVTHHLPEGKFTQLLSEGIIPGLGGILIFIPQIAILFTFIALLEESGYMSRVVFLMDKIMRRFGMSGKSVLPLISGTACAIPAILSSRNIESWRERLITILVTPFVTCSARLPVYAIIIALIIPENYFLGIFNLQGLTLMGLYLLGFAASLGSAVILNKMLKIKNKSFFVIEMPNYKIPSLRNTLMTVWDKSKAFVLEAGKIILAISIVLWFLASHGSSQNFRNAEKDVLIVVENSDKKFSATEIDNKIAAYRLENSYLGNIGKFIEPAIAPLGYDWKIGIALLSSFAAREVFVGTLATIYSVGNDSDNQSTVRERMLQEKTVAGKPSFNFASGISLLLFYAFAMQCMGTLAVVKKETNTWKWSLLQLLGMTALAYMVSFIAFQFLK